ncbi:isochorismatase family protein [Streptomyces kurssanovii]|uniref:Isochorismatase family protein n=1 Tax=Streptomyces kurssanovii TaxID=67312 RepID=A0ABV3HPW2_9ACTN
MATRTSCASRSSAGNATAEAAVAQLITAGLWTEVCLAFTALDAVQDGFEVHPVSDAVGGISPDSHERAMQRMIQAGAHPVTAPAVVAELQRDWARGHGDKLRDIMRWYFPVLNKVRAAG